MNTRGWQARWKEMSPEEAREKIPSPSISTASECFSFCSMSLPSSSIVMGLRFENPFGAGFKGADSGKTGRFSVAQRAQNALDGAIHLLELVLARAFPGRFLSD